MTGTESFIFIVILCVMGRSGNIFLEKLQRYKIKPHIIAAVLILNPIAFVLCFPLCFIEFIEYILKRFFNYSETEEPTKKIDENSKDLF